MCVTARVSSVYAVFVSTMLFFYEKRIELAALSPLLYSNTVGLCIQYNTFYVGERWALFICKEDNVEVTFNIYKIPYFCIYIKGGLAWAQSDGAAPPIDTNFRVN